MPMIKEIKKYAASDRELKMLLDKAEDYARVYVLARQRQKGCDGMGEMTNLKDEFKGVLDELLEYCKNKNYISVDSITITPENRTFSGDNFLDALDIDSLADELIKNHES